MSIPKFFQSTDAGAPVLTASAGSLNALLKACLINGYGSKPSAGWELVFENLTNHQLVVRSQNVESDQCCYLFNDSNAAYTTIAGFEDFHDGVGIQPFNSALKYALKRTVGAVNGQLRWAVVADEKSCWVMIACETAANISIFFGDYIAFNGLKKHSIILGATNNSYSGGNMAFGTLRTSSNFGLMPENAQGFLGSNALNEDYGFGNRTTTANKIVLQAGDQRVFQPVKVFELANSVRRLAGILPGYLICEVSTPPTGFFSEITHIAGMPNQTVIEFVYSWAGTHFLNISEW